MVFIGIFMLLLFSVVLLLVFFWFKLVMLLVLVGCIDLVFLIVDFNGVDGILLFLLLLSDVVLIVMLFDSVVVFCLVDVSCVVVLVGRLLFGDLVGGIIGVVGILVLGVILELLDGGIRKLGINFCFCGGGVG